MSNIDYPKNWQNSFIGEVSQFVGRGVSPSYSETETDSVAINQKCVRNGHITPEFGRFHKDQISLKSNSILKTGDVCVNSTGDGTIGRIGLWKKQKGKKKYFVDTHVTIVRPNSRFIDPKYLCEVLSSDWVQNDLTRFCFTGSTNQIELNRSSLIGLKLYYPELFKQQKIAKILSTVDNLIDQTQALIDKYTAIKQGMMADLFTRGIAPNTGQLRPSVEEAPELYQKTELGYLPKGWDVQPLGYYLSMITYGFTNPMPETDHGPWMVTAANVFGGIIDYKKTRKTSLEAFNTLLTQKSKPKIGDVLLTKDGTLGRLAIVDNEYLCINQSVALLRCNEKAKPEFIKILLETEKYHQKMLDDAGGSTIKHIYITVVDKMLLGVPDNFDEQVAILGKIDAINKNIETEESSLEKYRKQKKGLMQDLLTGKVQVS